MKITEATRVSELTGTEKIPVGVPGSDTANSCTVNQIKLFCGGGSSGKTVSIYPGGNWSGDPNYYSKSEVMDFLDIDNEDDLQALILGEADTVLIHDNIMLKLVCKDAYYDEGDNYIRCNYIQYGIGKRILLISGLTYNNVGGEGDDFYIDYINLHYCGET